MTFVYSIELRSARLVGEACGRGLVGFRRVSLLDSKEIWEVWLSRLALSGCCASSSGVPMLPRWCFYSLDPHTFKLPMDTTQGLQSSSSQLKTKAGLLLNIQSGICMKG
jgi:hypothetical protein